MLNTNNNLLPSTINYLQLLVSCPSTEQAAFYHPLRQQFLAQTQTLPISVGEVAAPQEWAALLGEEEKLSANLNTQLCACFYYLSTCGDSGVSTAPGMPPVYQVVQSVTVS